MMLNQAGSAIGMICRGIVSKSSFFAKPRLDFGCIRELDDAIALFHEMVGMRHPPSVVDFTKLLGAVVKMKADRTVEDALQIFFKLTEKGISPNFPTYSSRIQGLCSCSRWKEEYLLHEMAAQKISLDVFTFSILTDAYYKEWWKRLSELPSEGLQPNVTTYTTFIGALCREGLIEEAKDLPMKMKNSGCLPNSVTYNVFVQGFLREFHEAIPLVEEMNRRRFSPDSVLRAEKNEFMHSLKLPPNMASSRFTLFLVFSILFCASMTPNQVNATRLLGMEKWLKEQALLLESLPRGPVPPSGSSPCTYIPGQGGGPCPLNERHFAGRRSAHAAPADIGFVVAKGHEKKKKIQLLEHLF
ncbi:Pentatricopeptide repeat-containing protein, mitochondrial [Sesamum angolense]|uniref:Pentatricopeptide repeat-containing protein, mitochondrial n=1 Tax=Sesamum angolense TaxID=2727404 RepID=A0AAE2C1S1_9LAMI|nr:Pentatricopeptide repeat-containing protein, mitochondrial [Sesamum angolense]